LSETDRTCRDEITEYSAVASHHSVSIGCNASLAGDAPLYLNPAQAVDARVADLISLLALEEKAILLNHRGPIVERFNIRADHWNQCLNGVKWDRPTTLFPICLGISATWNTRLVHEVANVLVGASSADIRQRGRIVVSAK